MIIGEQGFIRFWQQTDFSTYNEADIREEFIAKLLYLLGYSKNTINDIIREKSLKLSEPFQRIGRKQVKIDYVPSIRLKSFWILEAKAGNPRHMDVGDMLQAYLYAIHPEIQVPYIVLCNGWEIQIFDVNQIQNWNQPMFVISYKDCTDKFSELRHILSVDTLLNFQRNRLLNQIKNTFEAEIDIDQLTKFKNDFLKMKPELEKKIKENEKQLWRSNFEKNERAAEKEIKEANNETLILWMDSLANGTGRVNQEYYCRIEDSTPKERTEMILLLMQHYLGRPHSIFKCNCVEILLKVVINRVEIESSPFLREPQEELKFIIEKNLSYYDDNELQNALCYLDRTCCKTAAVIIKNELMDKISEMVEDKNKCLSAEERICENHSVAKAVVPWIFTFGECLWRYFSRMRTSEEIWMVVHQIINN